MRKYRHWILSLGIVAAPSLAVAESSPFGNEPQTASRPADGEMSNQSVAESIAAALGSAKLPGSNIDITVSGGVAKLSGQIADDRAKAMATQLVSNVPGVKRVDNLLETPTTGNPFGGVQQAAFDAPFGQPKSKIQQVSNTIPAPAPVPLPASAPEDNQQVAERVGAALSNANLSGYRIKIHVNGGVATLAGTVSNPQQHAMAGQLAQSVAGVNRVNNQLRVTNSAAKPNVQQVAYQDNGAAPMPPMGPPSAPAPGYPGAPGGYPGGMMAPGPAGIYGTAVPGSNPTIYNQPYMPNHAWPAQAQYPNSAAVQYPKQYSASAWPYIGPFYPYPQVPLGWRKATLEWDDGHWMMDFDSKTDRWFWFMNPKNW